ncbi:MAG: hypothetical protein ACLPKB_26505 [Xanthobacteraceae bacterium]
MTKTFSPDARRALPLALLLLSTLATIDLVGVPAVGRAAAEGVTRQVRFARGSETATLSGGVVRGDRDVYVLRAEAGQPMRVSITSLEHNAVFQIAGPDGRDLAGAREGEDADGWSGRLAQSGDYRITVGGTRGNATYTLTVGIGRK